MSNYVATTAARESYTGDGSTTEFDFNYDFSSDEDLAVYIDDSIQALNTDYYATPSTDGEGSVTFYSAPDTDSEIKIIRQTVLERQADFETAARFTASLVDSEFDQNLRIISDYQLNDSGIKVPLYKVEDWTPELEEFVDGGIVVINDDGTGVSSISAAELIGKLEGLTEESEPTLANTWFWDTWEQDAPTIQVGDDDHGISAYQLSGDGVSDPMGSPLIFHSGSGGSIAYKPADADYAWWVNKDGAQHNTGDLFVGGGCAIDDGASIGGELIVGGELYVSGDQENSGDLSIDGDVSAAGASFSEVDVSGTLTADILDGSFVSSSYADFKIYRSEATMEETDTEFLSIYLDDNTCTQRYRNDEAAGYIQWSIYNADDESNDGADANVNIMKMYGDSSNCVLQLNGNSYLKDSADDEVLTINPSSSFSSGVTVDSDLTVSDELTVEGESTFSDTADFYKITFADSDALGIAFATNSNYRTSGNYICGGNDAAGLSSINNVSVQTWYGFSVSPTITGQAVDQGTPAFSVNARNGNTYIAGTSYIYGDCEVAGAVVVGTDGGGQVGLTVNDGYGNANVTFNHANGVPDQDGVAARLEVNVDNTTSTGCFVFGLANDVSAGTATDVEALMYLYENYMYLPMYSADSPTIQVGDDTHGISSYELDGDGTTEPEGTPIILHSGSGGSVAYKPEDGDYVWWVNNGGDMYLSGDMNVTGDFTCEGDATFEDIETTGNITCEGYYATAEEWDREKYRLYGTSDLFTIGAIATATFGGLTTSVTAFQTSAVQGHGWWFGTASHEDSEGAMALTGDGLMTVAGGMRIGYGTADTTSPEEGVLDVSGSVLIGDVTLSEDTISSDLDSSGTGQYSFASPNG